MSDSLPPAAYIILGMLRIGARSGYDVKRQVDVSTRYFSNISPPQIYPLLKQLEERGFVRGSHAPRGNRRRRSYELTRDGERELRDWLRTDEPPTLDVRDEGLLKLFFADALGRDEALELVARIRARSERIVGELRRQSAPAAKRPAAAGLSFPELTLGFGLAMHEAWIKYCDELTDELAAGTNAPAASGST